MSKMNVTEIKANFDENLEKLKTVHTRKELEEVKKEVYKWRNKLLECSEDFRREIEERQRANLPGRPNFDERIRELKGKAGEARRKADLLLRSTHMTDPRLREMNDMLRMRAKVQGRMICPECGELDRGNVMSTGRGKRKVKVPWCFKCNIQLVPENKVKKWKRSNIKLRKKFTDEEMRMGYK